MRTTAIVNLKGGVGKTTTAVHLGAWYARDGRTLLVDADPRRSALSWSEKAGEEFPAGLEVVALPVKDLHRRLPAIAADYWAVVIDTPPNDGAVSRSAVMAADVVVVPMAPSTMDLDRLVDTLQLVAEVEALHPVSVNVLITRARARTRLGNDVVTVLRELEAPVLDAVIPLRERYAAACGSRPDPDPDYRAVAAAIDASLKLAEIGR